MNRTTQSTSIKQAINELLDKGLTDKQDIYTKVVEELGVPRPTVRRVARDLRNELLQKIKILQSEVSEVEGIQRNAAESSDSHISSFLSSFLKLIISINIIFHHF